VNHEVIITCAVTGAGDTVGRHPAIPVTPKEIAAAAIEAAKAGATVAHCHVRDPRTGKPSRDVALYRELVERIRESDTDVIINLTAGMGGDLEIGRGEQPLEFGAGTDLVGPLERLKHVEELLPEICTLDCGTLNFGDGDFIYVSTPAQLRAGAKRITELGVKAELEIFDTGHLWFAKQMLKEGLLDDPLFQICLGGSHLGRFRYWPLANADGGSGHAARRQRAGRPGRQHLAGSRRTRQQRPVGGARRGNHRASRRSRSNPGRGSRQDEPQIQTLTPLSPLSNLGEGARERVNYSHPAARLKSRAFQLLIPGFHPGYRSQS
jgi:hypothetical protein